MNPACRSILPDYVRQVIPDDEALHYEAIAAQEIDRLRSISSIFASLANIAFGDNRGDFPEPADLWLASTFECSAEYETFRFFTPLRGKTVLQLGGKGTEAVRMLMAGAKSAHLVSPVESELECGHELARLCRVKIESRLGLAENIPYPDRSFDLVYSSGSAHHFKTEEAFPEISRVLKDEGKFAAIEPWRAPFYKLGIRIFGKREKEVNCRPLDSGRVASLGQVFRMAKVQQFGTLSRYPMIAAHQAGFSISMRVARRVMALDDAVCKVLRLRSWGSCVAILAQK